MIAKFKSRVFNSPLELETFVKTDGTVSSVVAICSDNDGKLVLFYLTV